MEPRQGGKDSVAKTWASTRSAPGKSALWIDDNIGDFQKAGLLPLQIVACFRLQQQHQHIGQSRARPYPLAGAHRFHENHVEAEGFQNGSRIEMLGHGAVAPRCGEAADEDAVVVGTAGMRKRSPSRRRR